MDRFAVTYRLRPGAKETYIKAHNEIWPEMRDVLKRGGIRQMTIFLRGDTLFLYADVEDYAQYQALKAVDPVYKRWDAMITTLLEQPFDANEPGCFAKVNEVWHIEP
jgi:L-rhamnose mutarotase